jgi:general secretion pathway protein F
MAVFLCRVADPKGKIHEIVRESGSAESCLREISASQPFVISVREARGGAGRRRFPMKTVRDLTDLLALLLPSGLSLKDSLEACAGALDRPPGQGLVSALLGNLRKGASLADALEGMAGTFPPFYRGMVRVGERIGSLERVFRELSGSLKSEKEMRDKVVSALVYPGVVLATAFAGAVLLLLVLIPRLQGVFAELGPQVPARLHSLTAALGAALGTAAGLTVLAAVTAAAAASVRRRDGPAALRLDAALARVPLVSAFLLRRDLLTFASAMEAMTAAGVGVEEALADCAGTISNRALRADARAVHERVLKGELLSAAFARSARFPARVGHWCAIGERAGRVENVFGQLRAFYGQEVVTWVTRLTTLVEPALILGLGILLILFIVLFVVPVFSLYAEVL